MRVAVFFTPPAKHPLTSAATRWLGRDAFTGERFAARADGPFDAGALDALTAEPRRYGFHATMKAPLRLVAGAGLADAEALLADFCRGAVPRTLPGLRVTTLGAFFALVPSGAASEVDGLAACIVKAFEPLRAPLDPAELARQRRGGLTAAQEAKLASWGYPYVLDEFRFHMTLTGPVPPPQKAAMAELLHSRFDHFERPLPVDALALFVEDQPGADFRVHVERRLQGGAITPSER